MGPNSNPDPTSPSDSISIHSSTLDLPATANSIPGLVFIGFTPRIALHIFTMCSRYKDPSCSSSEATNYDFFSFIHGHIIYINNWTLSGLPDAKKMERLGVRKEVVDAILDERFRGVFGTQSLEYWIEETVRVNYETLLHMQDQVNNQETDLKFQDLVEHCNVLDPSPEVKRDHTILYKAIASTTSPLFIEDGTLDISTLASPRGNDSSTSHSAKYFSPQRSIAEQFREYITIRCPLASTLLLSICIPNDWLTFLRTEKLWYGDDWKQFIWHCKTKSPIPQHLQYLERADLVKGHICTKSPSEIARLKIENLDAEFRESNVFVLPNGEKAIQWCFREDKFREIMGGRKGKGYRVC